MSLTACLLAVALATPLGEPELAAVLRDGYHAVTGRRVRRGLLVGATAQVMLETGRGEVDGRMMILSRGHNLGAVGAAKGQPCHAVSGHRHRTGTDHVDAARAYWRAALRCSAGMRGLEDGDAHEAARGLAACGYHRTDVATYARGLAGLRGTAWRAVEAL